MIVIYPGSFDPIHYGHLDIILRASKMFDKVVVAIMSNTSKIGRFSNAERLQMANKAVESLYVRSDSKYENIEVILSEGEMLVDTASSVDARAIIRGVRPGDITHETALAMANFRLSGNMLETIFLPANPMLEWMSSTMAMEMIRLKKADVICPWAEDL